MLYSRRLLAPCVHRTCPPRSITALPMTDPGLTNRLRQHSRRSGLMVGLTMALTIAICIVGFIWGFVQLEPYFSDFIHRDPATTESRPPAKITEPAGGSSDDNSQASTEDQPTEEPPTPTPKPKPTQTSTAFKPDYQLTAEGSVNLRQGPGVNTEVITTLSPSQPLQFLGDEQESQNPSADGLDAGQHWLKFRTEDGLMGYVREIDVGPYSE
jgi:hypothetical protein